MTDVCSNYMYFIIIHQYKVINNPVLVSKKTQLFDIENAHIFSTGYFGTRASCKENF